MEAQFDIYLNGDTGQLGISEAEQSYLLSNVAIPSYTTLTVPRADLHRQCGSGVLDRKRGLRITDLDLIHNFS